MGNVNKQSVEEIKKHSLIEFVGIVLFNVLLFFFFFFILEFFAFCVVQPQWYQKISFDMFKNFIDSYTENTIEKRLINDSDTHFILRPPMLNKSFALPSILLLGCSFVYGEGLSYNETLGYQLSEYINRNVYNYGYRGGSFKETLYMLRYYNTLSEIKNPEYVLFIYISEHKVRMYKYAWTDSSNDIPIFKKINNRLVYISKRKFFYKSRILCALSDYIIRYKALSQEANDLLFLYFTEIHNEIKKLYPHAKFLILVYDEDGTENWNLLQQQGIEVIKIKSLVTEDLDDLQYRISDADNHPNARAWQIIIPALVKKLNL